MYMPYGDMNNIFDAHQTDDFQNQTKQYQQQICSSEDEINILGQMNNYYVSLTLDEWIEMDQKEAQEEASVE